MERPSKVINRVILTNPELTQTFTGTDINDIYQCLYRSRRSSYPKLPTNIIEVINVMSELQIKTVQDENFILVFICKLLETTVNLVFEKVPCI